MMFTVVCYTQIDLIFNASWAKNNSVSGEDLSKYFFEFLTQSLKLAI